MPGLSARNKTALAIEALLEGEAEALTRKAIKCALERRGHLCLDWIAPPPRDRPTPFEMPASLSSRTER